MAARFPAAPAHIFAGAQGLAGPHGAAGIFFCMLAGAHGFFAAAGAHGLAAGAQGLAAPAGPHGFCMPEWPAAGPHGFAAPHGLCIICATCIGCSAAATGVGAAVVTATAAAAAERLPASKADFSRLVCIISSLFNRFADERFRSARPLRPRFLVLLRSRSTVRRSVPRRRGAPARCQEQSRARRQ